MAKKIAVEKSKAQHIRDYLAAHPEVANAADVHAALEAQGVPVALSSIYREMSHLGPPAPAKSAPAKKKKKRGKKKARRPATATARRGEDQISVSALLEAKALAEQLGGVEQAKRALDALSKLKL